MASSKFSSNAVIVSGFPIQTNEDKLTIYFQSQRSSGGGDVDGVLIRSQDGEAVVRFTDSSAASSVLQRSHVFNGQPLEVRHCPIEKEPVFDSSSDSSSDAEETDIVKKTAERLLQITIKEKQIRREESLRRSQLQESLPHHGTLNEKILAGFMEVRKTDDDVVMETMETFPRVEINEQLYQREESVRRSQISESFQHLNEEKLDEITDVRRTGDDDVLDTADRLPENRDQQKETLQENLHHQGEEKFAEFTDVRRTDDDDVLRTADRLPKKKKVPTATLR